MKPENYNIVYTDSNEYIFVIMRKDMDYKNSYFKVRNYDKSVIIYYPKDKVLLKNINLKTYNNIIIKKSIRIVEIDGEKIINDYILKKGN